jgi:hypothetical protein
MENPEKAELIAHLQAALTIVDRDLNNGYQAGDIRDVGMVHIRDHIGSTLGVLAPNLDTQTEAPVWARGFTVQPVRRRE